MHDETPEEHTNLMVNEQLSLEGKANQKFIGNLVWDFVDLVTFGALEKKSVPAGTRNEEKARTERETKEE